MLASHLPRSLSVLLSAKSPRGVPTLSPQPELRGSQSLAVIHVARVLVFDLLESVVFDRSYDVIAVSRLGDGQLIWLALLRAEHGKRVSEGAAGTILCMGMLLTGCVAVRVGQPNSFRPCALRGLKCLTSRL